tara:strand:- start:19050 stop:20507 length:1458 start_codon:yes stop_codon:yes gene_type:complete
MKKIYILAASVIISTASFAQNIGINATGAAPNASAMLDVSATNKGVLIPRVALSSTTSNAPIGGGVATSLLVYNTATAGSGATAVYPGYYYWDGSKWVAFGGSGGKDWSLLGNAGTTAGTNFLGTTDAQALDFRTNNTIRLRIANGYQALAYGNGSAGAPFYSWNSDTDIGMYRITTNTLGFSTAGVERFRMSTTEAVFNDASNNYDFRVESDGQTDMFVIDASANRIGFNAGTAPSNPITFNSTGENSWLTYWENTYGSNTGALAQFNQTSTSNGNRVLMGVTNYSGSAYQAAAVIGLSLNNTNSGSGGVGVEADANNESGVALLANLAFTGGYTGWAGYFNADVYCAGTYFGSDKRLKKDIKPIDSALDIVSKLNPVSFNYDVEKYPKAGFEENLRFGFIAQEVEQVLPNIVKDKTIFLNTNTVKTTGMSSEKVEKDIFKVVDYVSIVPILTKAIKEQQQIINEQQKQIDELKELVNKLYEKQ